MQLWTKSGSYPSALPPSDTDQEGRIWTDLSNNPEGRVATGWAQAPEPPEYDPAASSLGWTGEAWTVDPLPPPPVVPPEPVRIGKYWLMERFSADQERRFAQLEANAQNLTAAQIADPAFEPLYQLRRFLKRLDALSIIELDAPATLAGFELLRLLGVFGDPASPASTAARDQLLITPTGREIT